MNSHRKPKASEGVPRLPSTRVPCRVLTREESNSLPRLANREVLTGCFRVAELGKVLTLKTRKDQRGREASRLVRNQEKDGLGNKNKCFLGFK